MRKFISIIILFALAVTTSFPTASHAMMTHDESKVVKSAVEKTDCHKTIKTESDDSDQCCDKNMCKCVGGTCHNGLSKILNNGDDLAITSSSSITGFSLTDDYIESSFSSRLKRPPKA